MRLGWAAAAETFYGSAKTLKASLHLRGRHLTTETLRVILTRVGSTVGARSSKVFQNPVQVDRVSVLSAQPRFGIIMATNGKKSH